MDDTLKSGELGRQLADVDMKIEKRLLFEVASVVSVVISLLFVAFQIQQANRIASVTNEIEVRNATSSLNELVLENPELIELLNKLQQEDVELTPIELTTTRFYMFRLLNQWFAAEAAYKNGMLPEESFGITLTDVAVVLDRYPAAMPVWRQIMDQYSEANAPYDVATLINEYLAK